MEAERSPGNDLLRDGVIQRFEYSHELALRFLRRALETVYGDSVDQLAYNNVLRRASERGLIENIDSWLHYRTARHKTSHTYDAVVAGEVAAIARLSWTMPVSFSLILSKSRIDLRPEYLRIVRGILHRFAPDREVRVFGSRAKAARKPTADLDLCIMDTLIFQQTVHDERRDHAALDEARDKVAPSKRQLNIDLRN